MAAVRCNCASVFPQVAALIGNHGGAGEGRAGEGRGGARTEVLLSLESGILIMMRLIADLQGQGHAAPLAAGPSYRA